MAHTPNMGATLLEAAQAQKEVTVNEALMRMDALLNTGAISKNAATPPASPTAGNMYIVADNATEEWEGKEQHIAYFDQIWRFIVPKQGSTMWVQDMAAFYYFDGAAWLLSNNVGTPDLLGVNTDADTTNRLSVSSEAVLFAAETNDMRTILSKSSAADTASFLFQNNFQGRAEFGLIGDDDFTLKLSSDGITFNTALTVNHITRKVTVNQQLEAPQALYDYAEHRHASEIVPTIIDGCSAAQLSSFGSGADVAQLTFADGTTQYAQASFRLPESWNEGAIHCAIHWGQNSGAAAHVVWAAEVAAHRNGLLLSGAYGSQTQINASANNNEYTHTADIMLDTANMQAGDILTIRIARHGADVNDTLANAAYLFGICLNYMLNGLHRN